MRRNIAVVICLLLVFLMLIASSCPTISWADEETPEHIPRVVSVVFDNSGSMYHDGVPMTRWAYASYAMQSLCAMMDSTDELYVTYLNNRNETQTVNLSVAAKQTSIDSFSTITFGGKTPYKVQNAADVLENRYMKLGTNAKYILLVLSDGELDDAETGELEKRIKIVGDEMTEKLAGADFSCEFFQMQNYIGDKTRQLNSDLRDISAKIMGKEKIPFTLNNGKITFDLTYPVFSMVIYAQKDNVSFSSSHISVIQNGSKTLQNISSYYIKCPVDIIKTSKTQHGVPDNPPGGVVSVIKNDTGKSSIGKGKYTVDLSEFNVEEDDIIVLAEPAVKVSCKYYIGNDNKALNFQDASEKMVDGDNLTIQCILYEINEDGTLGNEILDDNLRCEYSVTVNNKNVTEKRSDMKNAFVLKMSENDSNSILKVNARLGGYSPFVYTEKFGTIRKPGTFDHDKIGETESKLVTKQLFASMKSSGLKLSFDFSEIYADNLDDYSIKSSYSGFPSGKCSQLKDMKLTGKSIELTLNLLVESSFSDFPDISTVSLIDDYTGNILYTYELKKVKASYVFEIDNPFESEKITVGSMIGNTKAITFSLKADYEGNGKYTEIDKSCEKSDIKISIDSSGLPGSIDVMSGYSASFVPRCDEDIGAIVGKTFGIIASTTIDEENIMSNKIMLSFFNTSYIVETKNGINREMDLDSLKNNNDVIIFTIKADYDQDGIYEDLAEWENNRYKDFEIDHETLPGFVEILTDNNNEITTGIAFTPRYDERDSHGVVYTTVAGHTHTVTGKISGGDVQASVEVTIASPIFTIRVIKEGISILDTDLIKNKQAIEYMVFRDDVPLSKQELEGLAPFDPVLERQGKWVTVDTEVLISENGDAFLKCTPIHKGSSFWNFFAFWRVKNGDDTMTLTVGKNTAAAKLNFRANIISIIIFWFVIAAICFATYTFLCFVTKIKYVPGKLCICSVYYNANEDEYTIRKIRTRQIDRIRFALPNKLKLREYPKATYVKIGGLTVIVEPVNRNIKQINNHGILPCAKMCAKNETDTNTKTARSEIPETKSKSSIQCATILEINNEDFMRCHPFKMVINENSGSVQLTSTQGVYCKKTDSFGTLLVYKKTD